MPEFIIQSGKHAGKKLVLDNARIVIGRDERCQIRISSKDVSRQHCLVQLTPAGWVVRDLGSQNGTFVNEVQLMSDRLLVPGDALRVGPMLLMLSDPEATAIARRESKTKDGDTTDDDIVGWLSDSGDAAASSDSTIITMPKTPSPPAAGEDTTIIKAPEPPRPEFKSLAEEAADIIRRHHQALEPRDD